MSFSNFVAAACPRYRVARALKFAALLSAPWMVATAAPSITGKPATTVTAAHYFAFQPSASNPGGGALTFAIANKPSWAQFDSRTGRLYGTPLPKSNVGTYSNIVISASAGNARASLAPFAVTVLPLPNTPPTLGGSPAASVASGSRYSFQPKATDPNGLKLVFSISNAPAWASFDSATGLLSGTPTALNVGTYSNIVITAYDGYAKAALPAFNIAVARAATNPVGPPPTPPAATGSATLSWTPPTQNANGSVLTDLAGYHIYYGDTPELGQSLTLANPGLTRYVMTGLIPATWYFAMTAYDRSGRESNRTEVASIVTQ
jgi:Putative Ig domain